MKKVLGLILILTTSIILYSQTPEEIWVPVDNWVGAKIYIDIQGLDEYSGDDFYVWAMQDNDPPLELEGVRKDIYKTKTYYLINKSLKKYSIAEIIYYDDDGNVITNYSYKINRNVPSFTYTYPIYEDTDQGAIFDKCMEYISAAAKK